MTDDIMAMGGFVRDESAPMGWQRGPKYPKAHVKLVGEDGNAFSILARVDRALARADVSKEEREAFMDEATSDDYDHLLATVMLWVSTS